MEYPENFAEYVGVVNARIAAMEDMVNATLAAASAPRPNRLLKPSKPEAFSGAPREPVDLWLFQIEQWLIAGGVNTEHERITLATGLLRHSALLWWRSIYGRPDTPVTWAAFKESITAAFQPINPMESARDRLANLRQTGPVRTYASIFRAIILEIPSITDDEKKDRFIRGLKPNLVREVRVRAPVTFEEAVTMSVRLDAIGWRASPRPGAPNNNGPVPMELGLTRHVTPANSNGSAAAIRSSAPANAVNSEWARPSYRDVTAGHINAVRARTSHSGIPSRPLTPRSKLTDRDRAELRRHGVCFKCRKAGHIARECPERENFQRR